MSEPQDNVDQRHSVFSRWIMALPEHGRKLLAALGVELEKPQP